MKRKPVSSSAILSAGYQVSSKTLEIEFEGGHIYQYHTVPQSVYRDFLASDSKGAFANSCLKEVFSFTRIH